MPDMYEKDSVEAEFIEQAIKAGVSFGQIEVIMVLSKFLEKPPLEVQNAWLDAHIGVQQILKELR